MARKKANNDTSDRLQFLLMMMHLKQCSLTPAQAIRILKRIPSRTTKAP